MDIQNQKIKKHYKHKSRDSRYSNDSNNYEDENGYLP